MAGGGRYVVYFDTKLPAVLSPAMALAVCPVHVRPACLPLSEQDVAIKRIASCIRSSRSHVIFLLRNIFPISKFDKQTEEGSSTPNPTHSRFVFYSIKLFDFRSNRRNFLMRMFRQDWEERKRVKESEAEERK